MNESRSAALFFKHLGRAMRLLCPACGHRPLFVKWCRVRCLRDWFSPLDGCPVCGYPYEREAGYYLMATWAVNYGISSLLGVGFYLFLELNFQLPLAELLGLVLIPVFLFTLLFARHAKAIFLAVDLFFDPHDRGGDDDRGNLPVAPTPPASPVSNPMPPQTSGRPCPKAPVLR